jgi:hypothetical protein
MSETSPSATPRRFDLKRVFAFLLHPRQGFEQMAAEEKPSWLTPMLVLSIILLLRVVVTGFLRARAAAMGEVTLPPDWQWWTPDMQNKYMQAMQATQGSVFLYIIPSITGLAGLWLGWGILSGLFHLASTLLGGRGKMSSALNVLAWSNLPFALRDLLRVVFMLVAKHPIASQGLSGFVTGTAGGALFAVNLLKHVDIFLVWYAILLIFGFARLDSLPRARAVSAVVIVLLLSLAAQAGLGTLSSSLSGMMITRPFF